MKLPIEPPRIDPEIFKNVDFESMKGHKLDKESPAYKKYVQPIKDREKRIRREKRRKWWSDRGMELAALVMSVVAIAISLIALLAQLGLIAVLPQT